MTTNDAIVLNSNFTQWKARADGLAGIQPWLYYCLEQFLKPYALNDEELQYGVCDSGNDGGVDALYFLFNQRQLVTDDSDLDPKGVLQAQLLFFQVKTSGGIKPTEIEKWLVFADDCFDLSKDPASFGTRYNDKIKKAMARWRDQYLRISGNHPDLSVDYFYITGDDASPDSYALDACQRVETKTHSYTKATCKVHCIGAAQLWEQVQKRPPKNRMLKWSENPMSTQEGFVGLGRVVN